jgi:hypothetical protein
MQRLLSQINQKHLDRKKLFAVEVEVEGESVYVVYWAPFNPPAYLVAELMEELNPLERNCYMVYNGTAYPSFHPTAVALVHALVERVKPCLAPLVTPTRM